MTIKADLILILQSLRKLNRPVSISDLMHELNTDIHQKTLQRRLKTLVEKGDVIASGEKKSRTYCLTSYKISELINHTHLVQEPKTTKADDKTTHPFFSKSSIAKLGYLDVPPYGRQKCTYQISLVDKYIPNESMYVPISVRKRLHNIGRRFDRSLAAGTYAKQIGHRLLIDLSYNSSRLEGNTYSKLDTQKLIEQGLSADNTVHEETVMIMNHKEAIEFMIENAENISLSSFTIKNIHHLLSQDLLTNPNACGREREIEVNIGQSAYTPLGNIHQIKEYLALLLFKAEQINDPFEQSFFLLLHLSYLQAFEDVNKRTARLSCNIPFIRHNLCPLSFIDVPQEDYFKVLLYFYETNELLPALELYEWAYAKSCEQYHVIKESLGEIDAYRIQHRAARKEAMGRIIRENISEENLQTFLKAYCEQNNIQNSDKFTVMTTNDLNSLHEGAIVGLGITEKMFKAWKAI